MEPYHITIGGETLQIRSDATEAEIRSLAAEIQERFTALDTRKGPRTTDQRFRIMSMVALTILAELRELQDKQAGMKGQAVEFARQMTERIDRILMDGFRQN